MSRELMQQALDYIKETYDFCAVMQQPKEREEQLIKALEQELAKPEQEPVVEVQSFGEKQVFVVLKPLSDGDKLYTTPPRKEWVGLTDEEIELLVSQAREVPIEIPCDSFTTRLLKLAETKLKELNK